MCTQQSVLEELRRDPENLRCFDCGEKLPAWCSTSFGILLCLACAGRHRGFGVHITLVQSCSLDSWKPNVISLMKCGGNTRAKAFLVSNNLELGSDKFMFYSGPDMQRYKDMLQTDAWIDLGLNPEAEVAKREQQRKSVSTPYRNASNGIGVRSMSSSSVKPPSVKPKESTCCCCVLQ